MSNKCVGNTYHKWVVRGNWVHYLGTRGLGNTQTQRILKYMRYVRATFTTICICDPYPCRCSRRFHKLYVSMLTPAIISPYFVFQLPNSIWNQTLLTETLQRKRSPLPRLAYTFACVALVHVDAHADFTAEMSGERITHGTPFYRAVEEGLLDTERVVQCGVFKITISYETFGRCSR